MAKGRAIGRGLGSLFEENSLDVSSGVSELRLSEIEPNRDQPRKHFDEAALEELAESIRQHGLIQPILVRPAKNGTYSIIAGERRWRASRLAGLVKVPVIIKDCDDEETAQLALIENLQREDLNPIEEAEGYKKLMDDYSLTQEKVAELVGKSRPAIANALRLLGLPAEIRQLLLEGKITAGHARALLAINDAETLAAAIKAAVEGASVRDIEAMAGRKKTVARPREKKSGFCAEVELSLKEALGRKVKITPGRGGKGTITLEFYNEDELADFARRLAE